MTKEVDEKYEPDGKLKVQSKIVAWNVGEEVQGDNQYQVSCDENISNVKAERLLEKAERYGAITSGSPSNAYKSADAKLENEL